MTEPPILEERTEQLTGMALVKNHFKVRYQVLNNDVRIMKVIVFYSLIFASHALLFFYSQQYFYDSGYNKIQISIVFLFAGVISCLGALASDYLYQKLDAKLAFLCAVVIALTMVCYGLNIPILAVVVFIISYFFNAVLYPVESECLNRLIPSEQRATLISINSMFFSIMMIVMFPIAGMLADVWNLPIVLMGIGIVVLCFTLIWEKKDIQ